MLVEKDYRTKKFRVALTTLKSQLKTELKKEITEIDPAKVARLAYQYKSTADLRQKEIIGHIISDPDFELENNEIYKLKSRTNKSSKEFESKMDLGGYLGSLKTPAFLDESTLYIIDESGMIRERRLW